jgi:hypothetical protein
MSSYEFLWGERACTDGLLSLFEGMGNGRSLRHAHMGILGEPGDWTVRDRFTPRQWGLRARRLRQRFWDRSILLAFELHPVLQLSQL